MKKKLSAWMDGELCDKHARRLPPQLKRDADLRCNCDCYHLIGDALRGVQRPDLCARIRAEWTALASRRRSTAEKVRWFTLWVAASVAAGLVGWIVTHE